MAYHFIDEIFEKNMMDSRTNINIYMFIYKISQTDIIKATGYVKSTVSKAVSGYEPISKEFLNKFCEAYNIPINVMEMKPIYFYSHLCKEKRKQILEETGTDPGDLRDIDLLKEYRYNPKPKSSQSNSNDSNKNSVKIEEQQEVKQEVVNKDKLYLAAKYKRKILRKESFTEVPLMLLASLLVITIIYIILSVKSADYIYALVSLVMIPFILLALRISKKKKLTVYVSSANDFSYEIDDNIVAKPLIIIGFIELIIFLIFLVFSIVELFSVKLDSDSDWMKVLYVMQFTIIAIGTMLSCSFNYCFPKKLTNKVLFADKLCEIGFFMQFASLIVFIALMILKVYDGLVLFFDIPLVIASLIIYIMSKIYLSKYKLYEYIFDKKIPFEQNKNAI